jgi:hypothetical protein
MRKSAKPLSRKGVRFALCSFPWRWMAWFHKADEWMLAFIFLLKLLITTDL